MEVIQTIGLQIFLETCDVKKGDYWTSVSEPGLWLGTLTKGRLQFSVKDTDPLELSGNTDIRFWSDNSVESTHRILQTGTMSAMFIHVQPNVIEKLFKTNDLYPLKLNNSLPILENVSKFCKVLTWQMFGCQNSGTERELYIAGKALEYISHAISNKGQGKKSLSPKPIDINYSPKDIEAFYRASSIILADLQTPPSVPELALQVGINARKLGQGFSRIFGQTVYAYIKEQRLKHARLLIDGGVVTSVSEAAYIVGYHPAHFSTEFRRYYE